MIELYSHVPTFNTLQDRLNLLASLIPLISPLSLHIIPSLIPEAVLGTKEPSEKARSSAFELIIAMGRKMNEGGLVKRNLIDGMDEDGATAKEGKQDSPLLSQKIYLH